MPRRVLLVERSSGRIVMRRYDVVVSSIVAYPMLFVVCC